MFREMKRKDRALDQGEIVRILNSNAYGILSTIGDDGYPYGVPISYIFMNDVLYVHGAKKGHKFDNIAFSDKVSFSVVGNTKILSDKFSTNFESAIAFGRALEVFDEEKLAALSEFINKYCPDFLEQGKIYIEQAAKATRVFRIEIEHLTGKRKDEK